MTQIRILGCSVTYFDLTKGEHVHLERHTVVDVPGDIAAELVGKHRAALPEAPVPGAATFPGQPPAPKIVPVLSAAWRVREGVRRALNWKRHP